MASGTRQNDHLVRKRGTQLLTLTESRYIGYYVAYLFRSILHLRPIYHCQ